GALALAVADVLTRGVVGGFPFTLATVAVPAVAWTGYAFRLIHLEPAGPAGGRGRGRGGGWPPPGGAGVWEPRRPLPTVAGGAAPLPVEPESPGQAVAFG
ncbi:MAG TPA: hypothetical protein VFX70_18880, partial [Mycobacteriales bacterium]|nr:hypothetical protein [Mycobacteriales bacterium]